MQFIEGTSFHASLGRTGMKKRASFEIFVRQIRTTVRKWELCQRPNRPKTANYATQRNAKMLKGHQQTKQYANKTLSSR